MTTPALRFFGPADVVELLGWDELIRSIEDVVTDPGATAPERTVHTFDDGGGGEASLLLKPGWVVGDVIVVKAVTFFGDNGRRGLPTVNAGVLLFDATTGVFVGASDGNELTTRRTAAASAVAAKRLARMDAHRLLVVGTGALAPMAARAHVRVRNYETIEVWGRDESKVASVVGGLVADGLPAIVCSNLDDGVSTADVISCVTGATSPLVRGDLLRPGTHVDLVGSFTPEMRESDDEVMRRATIFVDTYSDGVIAGDLAQPLADGVITTADLAADLRELVAGEHPGRTADDEITVFKSAGFALEDVAAARLVFAQ